LKHRVVGCLAKLKKRLSVSKKGKDFSRNSKQEKGSYKLACIDIET
jgi:hypothetical protein